MGFQTYIQYDSSDCGATCLRMIAKYYGKKLSQDYFHARLSTIRSGTSLLNLSEQAKLIGLENTALAMTFEELMREANLPCIIHWKKSHFVVVTKVQDQTIQIADPAFGLITYNKNEFLQNWISIIDNTSASGIVLLLKPTPEFKKITENNRRVSSLKFILK